MTNTVFPSIRLTSEFKINFDTEMSQKKTTKQKKTKCGFGAFPSTGLEGHGYVTHGCGKQRRK